MNVEIVPFQTGSPLLSDAAQVYTVTWNRDFQDSYQYFARYARFPHFYGLVAVVGERVVGTAFGIQTLPGQWWHDKVAARLGRAHAALQHAWVLVELAVVPAYRNQSVGGRLHDCLVQLPPFPNLLLSTQVTNFGARRFYERRGWHILHRGFSFHPGSFEYMVMQLRRAR